MQNEGISTAFAAATALFGSTAILIQVKYQDLDITDPEFTFEAGQKYTPSQLDIFASLILRQEIKQGNNLKGKNPILLAEHLKTRQRREIYNSTGVPDPSIQQGLYWRVHPSGRKVNSEEARKKSGASFYR
jgi:hypothetical protein